MNAQQILVLAAQVAALQEDQRLRAEQIRQLRATLKEACKGLNGEMFLRQDGQVWRVSNIEPDNPYSCPIITPVNIIDVMPVRGCREDE